MTFDEADRAAFARLVARVGVPTVATWLSPTALASAIFGDTQFAAAALEALREPTSAAANAITAALPEAAALAAPMPAQVEHDAGSDRPLLDHVATRLLARKLHGLERRDRAHFQQREGLTQPAFDRLCAVAHRVLAAGLGPALRAAMIHLDIAKTRSQPHRDRWTAWLAPAHATLEVHNVAAAMILGAPEHPCGWPMAGPEHDVALHWIRAHGLAGQHVRGEGPLATYRATVMGVHLVAPPLAAQLGIALVDAEALILDGLHVIDACDTSAVREGLLDDALLAALATVRAQLGEVVAAAPLASRRELTPAHWGPAHWAAIDRALTAFVPPVDRAALADRLRKLRGGRQRAGEPASAVDEAVAALGDEELAVLAPALATCQLWYCEAATSGLSPAAQLALLAAAVGAARARGIRVATLWHAQLQPLVARLHGESADVRYRLRLVEAALASTPVRSLLTGTASLGPLGALSGKVATDVDADTIVIDYVDTAESAALVTLLGTYETRDSIAYHAMLKALCDLYGLRKDELDRVANEANYLAAMNAARSDKERMLDHVRPGTIVEIGPGGGVVLDLLEARYPESQVIGVDLSREVVAALERRARQTGKHWRVVLGAAEALPALVTTPIDTVVFCSILHEVYSYTPPRFSLASVERVIGAAVAALAPGGRIIIRDGVMPPPGRRRIRMLAPDVRSTLDLYVAQFEGRPIAVTELAPDRVELSTADAMEFLYTYTWGPASFPYEVRELYGILPYDEYVAALIRWCGGPSRARVIDTPLHSYLQPGYRDHLASRIALTDERDRPVELPDSNALIVIEKLP